MSFGFNIQNLETVLQSDCTPENWGYLFQNCTKWNDCDRRTIRPYVECRLSNDIAVGLYNDWNPGDILILGDSLTDFATAFNYNPVLPRAFNRELRDPEYRMSFLHYIVLKRIFPPFCFVRFHRRSL